MVNPVSRQARIRDLVVRRGGCSVDELATQLGVSGMTVRRDLQSLEEQGQVIRTHGGATVGPRVSFEFAFLSRVRENQPAKEAIGQAAAELCQGCSAVMLDGSTTTLAIARQLRGRSGLTVITTSLPAAAELQHDPYVDVLLPGGYIRPASPDLTGSLTELNLGQLRAEVAFLGADGIDSDGFAYTQPPDNSSMLLKMAASAERVYVTADSSKFGRHGMRQFAQLAEWTGLVTDDRGDPGFVDTLRENGVNVVVVQAA